MLPIITVSREFASGGHSIAEQVAKELNIPFYDSDIIEKTAERSGYAKSYIEDKGEYTSSYAKWFASSSINPTTINAPQDEIFAIQTDIILRAMKEGPCVIVGRCGDYVSDINKIPALNIFIHASMEQRKKNFIERYGDQDIPVEKLLTKKDKGRKYYYKYYTDRNWGEYTNYHINLDSGLLGEKACVNIIVNAARAWDK